MPYREASIIPSSPKVSWFGKWLCRRRWHSYKYFEDDDSVPVEKIESRDVYFVRDRVWAILYCYTTIERCKRCGVQRGGMRFENRHPKTGKVGYIWE